MRVDGGFVRHRHALSSDCVAQDRAPTSSHCSRIGCRAQESCVDKTDPPESFGVFKPVGHTVIAYRSLTELNAAADLLMKKGFASADLVRYSPEEMMAQVDEQLPDASPLASIGQDLNLIKAHRALAESGCSFLVVHAPKDEQAEIVAEVARGTDAVAAQNYGRFIVEEVIDTPADDAQVFESPDRGLDLPASADPQR